MGQVWQAVHRASRVPVAVKVLTARAARDPWYLERFHTEVRAVAGLSHPGIALLFDYGDLPSDAEHATEGALIEGSPYLVMELARGGTLARWLSARPPWEHLKAALLLLLDALAHAHARGVIHRDLKPSNVLVCSRGDSRPGIKISDFGIAQRVGERGRSAPVEVLGTPGYMAPEQWCEDATAQGPWTDLFALGAMCRGVLEGRAPGSRKPALALPVLPAGVEAWLARLTDPDVSRRYPRAADAAEDLSRLGGVSDPLVQAGLLALVLDEPTLGPVPGSSAPTWSPGTWGRTLPLDALDHHAEALEALAALEPPRSRGAENPAPVVERRVPVPERWRRADPPALPPSLVGAGLRLYGLRVPPLVGRDAEMDQLWAALRRVAGTGAPAAVVVSGPPGIGKSHLLSTLAERAHELGVAEVLCATHSPTPGPEDGVLAALARLIGMREEAESDALERVACWLGEAPSAPSVTTLCGLLRAPPGEASAADPHRFGALVPALARLTRRRVLILTLEDASVSDEALALARWILERAPTAPILVALTLREQDPADAVEPLALRTGTLAIRLGPVPSGHQDLLVRSLLDLEAGLRAVVLARTGGHPQLAAELIGEWAREGLLEPTAQGFALAAGARVSPTGPLSRSPRMSGFYASRTPSERLSLERAAVLGLEVELELWAEMAPELRPLLEPLTRALLDEGLARSSGGGSWTWAHFQGRETVLSAAGDRLVAHHLAAARALDGVAGALARERLGQHLLAAGRHRESMGPLLDGARGRLRAGEPGRCLTLLDSHEAAMRAAGASELDPQWARHWFTRASAAADRGLPDEVIRCLDAMNAAAARAFDAPLPPASRAIWRELWTRTRLQQAQLVDKRGRPAEALRICQEAIDAAVELNDPTLLAAIYRTGASALHHQGDLDEARAWLVRARAAAERGADPDMAHRIDYTLTTLLLTQGALDQAEPVIDRALAGFRASGLRWFVASALNLKGEIARGRGDLERAEACYRAAWEEHQAIFSVETVTQAINLGIVAVQQGRYAASLRHLEQGLADAQRLRWTSHALGARATLLVTFAGTGAWEALDEQLSALVEGLNQHGVLVRDIAEMAELAGQLAARARERDRALALLRLAERHWRGLDRLDMAGQVAAQIAAL